MKKIIFFIAATLLMTAAFAQKPVLLKQSDNKLFNYGRTATVTTTDSTLTAIDSIVIAADEAGIVEVQVVGFNDSTSTAVTGSKILRYVKDGGTLTLGSATNVLTTVTDATLGTATWTVTTSGDNIIVQVKGKAGFTVRWQANTRRIYRKT